MWALLAHMVLLGLPAMTLLLLWVGEHGDPWFAVVAGAMAAVLAIAGVAWSASALLPPASDWVGCP